MPPDDDGYVAVGHIDDLVEGQPLALQVGGREIILMRWREDVFATRSICPHQQASLATGVVRAHLVTGQTFGEVSLKHEEVEIVCPWHAWAFDLRTGLCRADSSLRIRSYDVRVDDGTVLVDLESHRSRGSGVSDSIVEEVST
jgi:3-phenylpropionate/trans-cinnamate dioxygenase ferredoxin subunit